MRSEPLDIQITATTRDRKLVLAAPFMIFALAIITGCSDSAGPSDGPRSLGYVECESQSGACWGPTVEKLVDRIFEEDAALAADCREAGRDAFFEARRDATGEPPWAEGSATTRVGQCEVEVTMVPGLMRGAFYAP